MKKATMKQTTLGYEYKGVQITKAYYAREMSWRADGKVFLTLKEARSYIDKTH